MSSGISAASSPVPGSIRRPGRGWCVGSMSTATATQWRVTCYRAGMRIGEPRMAAPLVSHGRPGFYCRAITEGEVEAGQDIVKSAPDPSGCRSPRSTCCSTCPAIPATPCGARCAFLRSLSLSDPDGAPLPTWLPGQSITVRLSPEPAGAPLIRNYSLSNQPGSTEYRISVKREPHGSASGHIHSQVQPGDLLDVAAQRGSFFLADSAAPLVLLSAGVGATPVLSMLHWLAAMHSERPLWWLHCPQQRRTPVRAGKPRSAGTTTRQPRSYLLQPSDINRQTGCRLHRPRPVVTRNDWGTWAAPRRRRLSVRALGVHERARCRPAGLWAGPLPGALRGLRCGRRPA